MIFDNIASLSIKGERSMFFAETVAYENASHVHMRSLKIALTRLPRGIGMVMWCLSSSP